MKPLDAALPILKYSLKIVITAIREMSAIKLFDTLIYALPWIPARKEILHLATLCLSLPYNNKLGRKCGPTTLSVMKLSKKTFSITISKNATASIMTLSKMAVLLCCMSFMLSVTRNPLYAKCSYAECRVAENVWQSWTI